MAPPPPPHTAPGRAVLAPLSTPFPSHSPSLDVGCVSCLLFVQAALMLRSRPPRLCMTPSRGSHVSCASSAFRCHGGFSAASVLFGRLAPLVFCVRAPSGRACFRALVCACVCACAWCVNSGFACVTPFFSFHSLPVRGSPCRGARVFVQLGVGVERLRIAQHRWVCVSVVFFGGFRVTQRATRLPFHFTLRF